MVERYYVKKRRNSLLRKVLYMYFFLIITRLIIIAFVFQIIQPKTTYNEQNKEIEHPLFSDYKGAKVLTLSSPYIFSLFDTITIARSPSPQKKEIVLIESIDYKNKSKIKKILFSFLEIVTIGIIKQQKYIFVEIVGLAYQTLYYSAKTVFESKTEAEKAKDDILFFETVKEITLSHDEVFVVSYEEYSVDSRVLGAMKLSDIKGKAYFVLHPYWKKIDISVSNISSR